MFTHKDAMIEITPKVMFHIRSTAERLSAKVPGSKFAVRGTVTTTLGRLEHVSVFHHFGGHYEDLVVNAATGKSIPSECFEAGEVQGGNA